MNEGAAALEYAQAQFRQGRYAEVLRALRGVPGGLDAMLLRARAYQVLGEPALARAAYEELLPRYPNAARAHSSYLIALQYDPRADAREIFEAHRNWAKTHLPETSAVPDAIKPKHDLRIGWASTGFRASPVAIFFKAVSRHLDRAGFTHVFYHDSRNQDELTRHFRGAADEWHETAGLDDDTFAERIRQDRIDILVELTGHGPGNRLRALNDHPAPLQVSWLDYFHSTGAPCMDVFLADEFLVPQNLRANFVEKVHYLERGRLCYSRPEHAAEPGPARDSNIIFGSFNRLAKLNDATLVLWARILERLPTAKLLLRAHALGDAGTRKRFLQRARAQNLPLDRLRIAGPGSYEEILESYRMVDVALDPYPFSGCATSCDALWMGVPVVTLCGETMASRQSAALLSQISWDDLIVRDRDAYVERAVALARDGALRRELRRSLRKDVERHLADAPAFARELCGSLRRLWRERHSP